MKPGGLNGFLPEPGATMFGIDRSCISKDGSFYSTTHDRKRLPPWRRFKVALGYGWRAFRDAWMWNS